MGAALGSAAPGVGTAFGAAIGGAVGSLLATPQGAEVKRQLANWPEWKLQLYSAWLKQFDPARWASGDVWASGNGNASRWNDAYYSTNAVNKPEVNGVRPWLEGRFTLDANLNPIPLEAGPGSSATPMGGVAPGGFAKSTAPGTSSSTFMDDMKAKWNALKPWQKVAWGALGAGVVVGLPVLVFKKRKVIKRSASRLRDRVRTRARRSYRWRK